MITKADLVWGVLGFVCLLPVLTASPFFQVDSAMLRLVLGIGPFSAILGFVTPMLVDRWSGGDPDRAGKAYAVNVVGCILGPLVAGFILLPVMSERWVLFVFALPWLMIGLVPRWSVGPERAADADFAVQAFLRSRRWRWLGAYHQRLRGPVCPVSSPARQHGHGDCHRRRNDQAAAGEWNRNHLLTPDHQDDGAPAAGLP